jgi:hypothetical protein
LLQHCGTGPLARLVIRKNATAFYRQVNPIGARLVEGLIALIPKPVARPTTIDRDMFGRAFEESA